MPSMDLVNYQKDYKMSCDKYEKVGNDYNPKLRPLNRWLSQKIGESIKVIHYQKIKNERMTEVEYANKKLKAAYRLAIEQNKKLRAENLSRKKQHFDYKRWTEIVEDALKDNVYKLDKAKQNLSIKLAITGRSLAQAEDRCEKLKNNIAILRATVCNLKK